MTNRAPRSRAAIHATCSAGIEGGFWTRIRSGCRDGHQRHTQPQAGPQRVVRGDEPEQDLRAFDAEPELWRRQPVDTDARIDEELGQGRAFVTDHVHVHARGGERARVVLHAGTASQIPDDDDGRAHLRKRTTGVSKAGLWLLYRTVNRVRRRPREPNSSVCRGNGRAGWRRRGGDTPPSIGCRRSARSRRRAIACASASDRRAASDGLGLRQRGSTVGATLPIAMRGRSRRRHPAITTFEIACAARVPTLRNHWRPRTAWNLERHDQFVGPARRSGGSRCRTP